MRALLVGMELVAARPVSAQVTVSLVGTRHHRQLLVHRHRTASRVLRARMSTRPAVAVWRAASTVLWGHMWMSAGVMRPQTALRVMLVGMELVAARPVSARVTVRLVGIPSHRVQLALHHHTASPVQSAHTSAHRAAVHPPTAQTVCSGRQTSTTIRPHRARCAHRVSTLALLPLSVWRVCRERPTWTVTQPHRVLRV